MNQVVLHNKLFEKYIRKEEIDNIVARIGKDLSYQLGKKNPVFIIILDEAFVFAADLLRYIKTPCEVDFIKINSYDGLKSSGEAKLVSDIKLNIRDREVVLIEDIIDTGLTIECLINHLKQYKPRKVNIATLLFKPKACDKKIKIDYIGKEISNDFIIGYGLDYRGIGRNFCDIYKEIK